MMIANDTNFAWNLRREVLSALVESGYRVTLVAQVLEFKEELEALGIRVVDVKTARQGTNPFSDIGLLIKYYRIMSKGKPDVVLTNNIKPNVYAGLVSQFKRIRYMPNITGLGTPVENPGKLQWLTTRLYKCGVRKASVIFFQNTENERFFRDRGMMPSGAEIIQLPGSGVNLQTHPLIPWPEGKIHFLFAARIMKEKGIDLFLAAAHRFASEDVVFDVCGPCDDVRYRQILENDPSVFYHDFQKDMTPYFARCSCFLYPSYYPEGMSNVLLEAAACGRPVIAADRAGCRETVEDGISGYIVPVNDEAATIDAVDKFLAMSWEERRRMGLAGRAKIEREFDRQIVVRKYLEEIGIVGEQSDRL